jgi:hypothetical protein
MLAERILEHTGYLALAANHRLPVRSLAKRGHWRWAGHPRVAYFVETPSTSGTSPRVVPNQSAQERSRSTASSSPPALGVGHWLLGAQARPR